MFLAGCGAGVIVGNRPFGSPECLGQTPRGSQPRGVSFPLAAGGSQAAQPILGLRSGLSVSLDPPLASATPATIAATCRARPFCAGERRCEHCWHGGAGRRARHLAVARYRGWAIEIGPIVPPVSRQQKGYLSAPEPPAAYSLAWPSHARCAQGGSLQRQWQEEIKSESGRQPTLALICSPQLLQMQRHCR